MRRLAGTSSRWAPVWKALALLLVVAFGAQTPVIAQPMDAGVGVEPLGSEVIDERKVQQSTHLLARRLRCPVCQGLAVADSQSDAAVAMRGRIEGLVRQGYTDEQIEDYFIERYGTWVLLAPPTSGFNLVIWLAPVAFLLLGTVFVFTRVGRKPEPDGEPAPLASDDPYTKRVLAELEEG